MSLECLVQLIERECRHVTIDERAASSKVQSKSPIFIINSWQYSRLAEPPFSGLIEMDAEELRYAEKSSRYRDSEVQLEAPSDNGA